MLGNRAQVGDRHHLFLGLKEKLFRTARDRSASEKRLFDLWDDKSQGRSQCGLSSMAKCGDCIVHLIIVFRNAKSGPGVTTTTTLTAKTVIQAEKNVIIFGQKLWQEPSTGRSLQTVLAKQKLSRISMVLPEDVKKCKIKG